MHSLMPSKNAITLIQLWRVHFLQHTKSSYRKNTAKGPWKKEKKNNHHHFKNGSERLKGRNTDVHFRKESLKEIVNSKKWKEKERKIQEFLRNGNRRKTMSLFCWFDKISDVVELFLPKLVFLQEIIMY